MINFIIYAVVSMFILWFFFINVMTWKKYESKIPNWIKPILKLIAIIGIVWDFLFNITFATVIFLELPKETMLTFRMQRILLTDDGWRFKVARFICRYLVEPWDPNHCGLESLKR